MEDFKNKKAITLIALIITIAVMLILVGVTVSTTLGENGLIEKTKKQAFIYEITEIQEQKELLKGKEENPEHNFGTLEQILGIDGDNKYNEMLCIENGELVYISEKVTEKQEEWLQEQGITPRQNIIPIYTLAQFEKIASGETVEIDGIEYTFNANSVYYLQNDIDFGGTAENPNSPITTTFAGVLDGQNCKLNNVYCSTYLFSKNSGRIKNLEVCDSELISALVYNNNGYMEKCKATDIGRKTKADQAVLVYNNYGTISNCSSESNTQTSTNILVCNNQASGIIENCYAIGTVYRTDVLRAGIVINNNGIVKNCYNLADIIGDGYSCGGIAYENKVTGKIINCYNKGELYARFGFCGGIAYDNKGYIVGCYNEGELTAYNRNTGGMAMLNSGTIISSYNVGSVARCWFVETNSETGKIIGCYHKSSKCVFTNSNTGTITNSYYYDSTNSVMCDAEGAAITINEGETETTALKRLLQAANDSLSTDEDYATKKVTWRVDASRNEGYPCFDWEID